MTQLPLADWQNSLDEMQTVLEATLAALERYQHGWENLLAARGPSGGDHGTKERLLGNVEGRRRDWDARLTAAADLADSVERDLNDRGAVLGRWQDSFTAWQNGIQRAMERQG